MALLTNFDRWLTTPPEFPEVWEVQGHCLACGAWLPLKADLVKEVVHDRICHGTEWPEYLRHAGHVYTDCDTDANISSGHCQPTEHQFQTYEGVSYQYHCRHCGTTNERSEF